MTNNRSDNNMAFQLLLGDLVENILKYSDNPGACAQYITAQIRELIGVRVVALLSSDEVEDFTLVGICPAKRENEWNRPEIQDFIACVSALMTPRFIDPATDHEGKSLPSIGIGKSFVIPLIVGDEKVGMLLLLDLMDEAGIKSILSVLTKISSILALILKNSLLYKNLEQRVGERTAALQLKISELKLSEERLVNLAEHSRTINWEVDAQGLYTYISSVSKNVIGYSPEELVGKKHFYDIYPEAGREEFMRTVFEVFDKKGTFKNLENAIQTESGILIWVSTNGIPLLNSDGSLKGYRGSDTDITGLKQAEEEKQILEQQMQQTQKLESLGVLSGGIAHDFNNILAIIIGYCGLTKMDYETAHKNIPEIEKAAERAAALCQLMLAYAGKAQLTKTQANIWVMVNEIITMLKSTLPQNAVIKSDLSTGIPCINADVSQLRQVVMNLIINASEAIGTEQGEIKVLLTNTAVTAAHLEKDYQGKAIPPGRYICLEVTDDGCGMDEETKWRIFEPFYTTKFTGRGLGMSAVLGIIKSHDGALQFSSQPGQGTTFKVYLPIPKSDTAGEEDQIQAIPAVPWQGNGTILLVEDEDQIRFLAKSMLEMFGFTVVEAVNGKQALELYQKYAIDIKFVLTDMGMPVMDGYSLFTALKQLNPKLPIIISSGFGEADVTSRIGQDNIAGIISKPYNPSQLREVLKSVVERMSS